MCLKVTDVKRLKKSELLELLEKSLLSTNIHNPTKEQLINCLQSARLWDVVVVAASMWHRCEPQLTCQSR